MAHQIPLEIASDIGALLDRLSEFGYVPTDSRYDSQAFGNYYVDLMAGKTWLRIVRERSQYYIDTNTPDQLRSAGMFRAFDDQRVFEHALLEWLRAA